MLTVIDEYTRECLAIVLARRLPADNVLPALTDLLAERGSRSTSIRLQGPWRIVATGLLPSRKA